MYTEIMVLFVGIGLIILLLITILILLIILLKKSAGDFPVAFTAPPVIPSVQVPQGAQQPASSLTQQQFQANGVTFCKNCYTQFDASVQFCPKCGTPKS